MTGTVCHTFSLAHVPRAAVQAVLGQTEQLAAQSISIANKHSQSDVLATWLRVGSPLCQRDAVNATRHEGKYDGKTMSTTHFFNARKKNIASQYLCMLMLRLHYNQSCVLLYRN